VKYFGENQLDYEKINKKKNKKKTINKKNIGPI